MLTAKARRPGSDAWASAALAMLTLASSVGLSRVFSGLGWLWPVVACISVTHAVLWWVRRRRVPTLPALAVGIATAALMVIWTVFGAATDYGLPVGRTWHAVHVAIASIGTQFATSVAPVHASRPFEMLAAAGAAAVALTSDWAAFRLRSPLVALLPSIAALIAAATAGRGPGRWLVVGLEAVAAAGFLAAERATDWDRQVWFAGERRDLTRWWVTSATSTCAVAVISAAVISPVLRPTDGEGTLGWRTPSGGGGAERVVPNPIVNIRTELLQEQHTPVFLVQSAVSSYWRLTSLDHFDGVTWTATGSYRSFGTRLPGVGSVPSGTRTVRATFSIQQLDSVWLPDQFDPVSVQGAKKVSFDPSSDSLLTSASTSNGLTYTVESYQYLSTLRASALESAPPVSILDPSVSSYIAVPAEMTASSVADLAATLTADQPTEYDKALAIQNYLLGPEFHYSLHPADDGSSENALENFLFLTRQGYCQQFASAFAVLARLADLPTRLAVGFSTGTEVAAGEYQVFDGNAHTWPEVWFGPQYGWVPFEPTPGFDIPGTAGYDSNGSGQSGAGIHPVVTVPTTVPSTSPAPQAPAQGHKVASVHSPTKRASKAGGVLSRWWAVPAAAGIIALVWGVAVVSIRQLRAARRRRRLGAESSAWILQAWEDVCAELAGTGLARDPSETNDEYARRAGAALSGRGIPAARPALASMAGMATVAAFGRSSGVSDGGQAALATARELIDSLRRSQPRTQKLRRALLP